MIDGCCCGAGTIPKAWLLGLLLPDDPSLSLDVGASVNEKLTGSTVFTDTGTFWCIGAAPGASVKRSLMMILEGSSVVETDGNMDTVDPVVWPTLLLGNTVSGAVGRLFSKGRFSFLYCVGGCGGASVGLSITTSGMTGSGPLSLPSVVLLLCNV